MRVVIFFLLMVTLSFNVNALAVASDYLENKTLFIEDGKSKLYGIRLQNSASEEIKLQLTYDSTIAKVIGYEEIYTVPPKSNKAISFNISAPPGSGLDDVFEVSYTVHELSAAGGGGIPFLTKISKNFKVKIIKDPDKFYIDELYVYIPQALIVLIIIFIIAIKKFGKKNKYGKLRVLKRKIK